MARNTGGIGALEGGIFVAVFTGCFGMPAYKIKTGGRVIEQGRFPTGGVMANAAYLPELTLMSIILLMACFTCLGSILQH